MGGVELCLAVRLERYKKGYTQSHIFLNYSMNSSLNLQINPKEIQKVDEFRKAKNTAILTILFTDIVGYTQFTEEVGEEKQMQYEEDMMNYLLILLLEMKLA